MRPAVATKVMFMTLSTLLLLLKTSMCKLLVSESFFVSPGGHTNSHVEKSSGFACEFTYACQGGTNEEWVMTMQEDEEHHFSCSVSRPEHSPTSYLFFQHFEMAITGGHLKGAVVLGEKGKTCNEDEYVTDTEKNLVYSASGFQSHLNSVFAVFTRHREDL
ncbi:myeloid-derived growth factor-like isoform X2 [Dreissena polymorpha]|nr:myeloid-derived growth factor-like isoform X2 [Dreissena polymorpha]XP_052281573.1 myeloid-derived growth factor-like isoform X2 [Dreissena polymorpha]